MAAQRDLWGPHYFDEGLPELPCPKCTRGNVILVAGSLRKGEPTYSKRIDREDLHPLAETIRFSCMLVCDVEHCGEIVNVHGNIEQIQVYDYRGIPDYCSALVPKSMYPAPPLAAIPDGMPVGLIKELRVAFQLFWVDLGSCANRLRIFVERLLDHYEVPAGRLNNRIEDFKAIDPEHAETFEALRHVGNVGSHEGEARHGAVLDAFEILQDALAELFGGRRRRIETLRRRLISKKGR